MMQHKLHRAHFQTEVFVLKFNEMKSAIMLVIHCHETLFANITYEITVILRFSGELRIFGNLNFKVKLVSNSTFRGNLLELSKH